MKFWNYYQKLNLIPLWEWMWRNCIFCVRWGWNTRAVWGRRKVHASEYKNRVKILACIGETRYDVTSILKVRSSFNVVDFSAFNRSAFLPPSEISQLYQKEGPLQDMYQLWWAVWGYRSSSQSYDIWRTHKNVA